MAAPLKMAPMRTAGSAPSTIPAGYMIGVKPTIVPIPVPTDTANSAARTNTAMVKTAPESPSFQPIQTVPNRCCWRSTAGASPVLRRCRR